MKINEFLEKLHEGLELEDDVTLTVDTVITDLEDYDSLMVLSIISFIHENFGKRYPADKLLDVKTVKQLMALIGDENFE